MRGSERGAAAGRAAAPATQYHLPRLHADMLDLVWPPLAAFLLAVAHLLVVRLAPDGGRRRRAEGGSLAPRPHPAAGRRGHRRRRADRRGAAAAAARPRPGRCVGGAAVLALAGPGRRLPAAQPAGQVPGAAGDHLGAGRRPALRLTVTGYSAIDQIITLVVAGRRHQRLQPARQHGRPGGRHRPHRRGVPLLLLPAWTATWPAPGWPARWPARWPASCSSTSSRRRSSWATPAASSSG